MLNRWAGEGSRSVPGTGEGAHAGEEAGSRERAAGEATGWETAMGSREADRDRDRGRGWGSGGGGPGGSRKTGLGRGPALSLPSAAGTENPSGPISGPLSGPNLRALQWPHQQWALGGAVGLGYRRHPPALCSPLAPALPLAQPLAPWALGARALCPTEDPRGSPGVGVGPRCSLPAPQGLPGRLLGGVQA